MLSPSRIVPRVAGVDAACLLHDQSELGMWLNVVVPEVELADTVIV
jgi:hypothetical protein